MCEKSKGAFSEFLVFYHFYVTRDNLQVFFVKIPLQAHEGKTEEKRLMRVHAGQLFSVAETSFFF